MTFQIKKLAFILLLPLLFVVGCSGDKPASQPTDLLVHYLDVGQADSILVQLSNGQNMLIDAGNNDDGQLVTGYLKEQGVKKIDYLVGTHPHEDHIGGLDTVINQFEIGNVYLPKVTHTTKTYQDVLVALKDKGLKVIAAKAGVEILNEDELQAIIISPINDHYQELNDYSAVIKLNYQHTSFLFTGDAEELAENEILTSGIDVKATVLKVGHHGSVSSTSDKFLAAVNPKLAIISVGTNNDYGHPHQQTLERLNKAGISVLRTDQQGTIIIKSDGKQVSSNVTPVKQPTTAALPAATEGSYLGSVNSDKYHTPDCPHVDSIADKNIIWFKDMAAAKAAGYQPCSNIKQ
ncbi:ComEC/Rec2 family competence protein [Peptococcaceae bacterium 1198_IL3148]